MESSVGSRGKLRAKLRAELRRFDLTAGQLSIYRDGQLLKSAALSASSLNAESIDEAQGCCHMLSHVASQQMPAVLSKAEAFTVGGQASAGSTDLRYFRGIFGELLLPLDV